MPTSQTSGVIILEEGADAAAPWASLDCNQEADALQMATSRAIQSKVKA
jgi:hypothetical protein